MVVALFTIEDVINVLVNVLWNVVDEIQTDYQDKIDYFEDDCL